MITRDEALRLLAALVNLHWEEALEGDEISIQIVCRALRERQRLLGLAPGSTVG